MIELLNHLHQEPSDFLMVSLLVLWCKYIPLSFFHDCVLLAVVSHQWCVCALSRWIAVSPFYRLLLLQWHLEIEFTRARCWPSVCIPVELGSGSGFLQQELQDACKVCNDFMRYALKTIIKQEIGWKARNVIMWSSVLRIMVRAWCSIPKSVVGESASEFSDLGQLTQVHSSLLVEWLVCLAQALCSAEVGCLWGYLRCSDGWYFSEVLITDLSFLLLEWAAVPLTSVGAESGKECL